MRSGDLEKSNCSVVPLGADLSDMRERAGGGAGVMKEISKLKELIIDEHHITETECRIEAYFKIAYADLKEIERFFDLVEYYAKITGDVELEKSAYRYRKHIKNALFSVARKLEENHAFDLRYEVIDYFERLKMWKKVKSAFEEDGNGTQ